DLFRTLAPRLGPLSGLPGRCYRLLCVGGAGNMGNFFSELKRRHVYRVAAAYVVVAWLILQVVNNVAPGLNLPNAAVTFVILLLAAGFLKVFRARYTKDIDSLAENWCRRTELNC